MLYLLRQAKIFPAVTHVSRTSVRLMSTTLGNMLDETTVQYPFKEALRCVKQEYRWSFQDLNKYVNHLADGLVDISFKKGDTLAVWLPNNAENLVTHFAAAKIGVTIAAIDPKITNSEDVAFILNDSKAKALIYEPKINKQNNTSIVQGLIPELAKVGLDEIPFRSKRFRSLWYVITTGFYDKPGIYQFQHISVDGMDPYVSKKSRDAVTPDTTLVVPYLAGASGVQKGKALTQADLLKQADALSKKLKLTPNDKVCMTDAPTGLSAGVIACLSKNAQLIIPSAEYNEEDVQHAMKLENCQIVGKGMDQFSRS